MKPIHFALLCGFLFACSKVAEKPKSEAVVPTPATSEEDEEDSELFLWVHADDLIEPVRQAALRIKAATGLEIHINEPDTIFSAVPVFWSDQLCSFGPGGASIVTDQYEYIVMSKNCHPQKLPIALAHELIHAMSRGRITHLPEGSKGLMSRDGGDGLITS